MKANKQLFVLASLLNGLTSSFTAQAVCPVCTVAVGTGVGLSRYRERFVGEFHRVLTLPGPADVAKMVTDYHNGVLTITVPKT